MAEKNAQLSQIEREECRGLVLGYLVERSELSFRIEAIIRGIKRETAQEYAAGHVLAAVVFLQGAGLVKCEPDALGATLSWQATSDGVLHHERSGR